MFSEDVDQGNNTNAEAVEDTDDMDVMKDAHDDASPAVPEYPIISQDVVEIAPSVQTGSGTMRIRQSFLIVKRYRLPAIILWTSFRSSESKLEAAELRMVAKPYI